MKYSAIRPATIAQSFMVAAVAGLSLATPSAAMPSPPASPIPDPNSTPLISFAGASPVAGCPQFFEYMSATDVNACAEQMTTHGWGLSAVAVVTFPLTFSGSFAPHMPKREVEGRYGFGDSTARHVIRLLGGIDSNWTNETEAGLDDGHCDEVRLYDGDVGGDAAENATRVAYVAAVANEAAKGCVPADEARVFGQEDESGTEDALFVRGDPRAFGSVLYGSKIEIATFEKRAAARGFQPLVEHAGFDLWGSTRAQQRVETIRVADFPAHWRSAFSRGERLVSIAYQSDTYNRPQAVLIWSR